MNNPCGIGPGVKKPSQRLRRNNHFLFTTMIDILCAQVNSNYFKLPGLRIWTEKEDAFNCTGQDFKIAHPPCAQWSRLKAFAKPNEREKELGIFCIDAVARCGGIVEQPIGSSLFKAHNPGGGRFYRVFQSDWGFPARKATLLWCVGVQLEPHPINWELPKTKVCRMGRGKRSLMPLSFCEYLVKSVTNSAILHHHIFNSIL